MADFAGVLIYSLRTRSACRRALFKRGFYREVASLAGSFFLSPTLAIEHELRDERLGGEEEEEEVEEEKTEFSQLAEKRMTRREKRDGITSRR